MGTETQRPTSIAAITALSPNDYTYLTDDPDSPDANWLVATSNTASTMVSVTFNTPSGVPTDGAGVQEFRAYVRQFDVGQSGEPDARIDLYENGVLVTAGSNVKVTGSGQVITLNWDSSSLTNNDGSGVEARVVGTKIGGPAPARNTVDVGAVEWNVTYDDAGGLSIPIAYHHYKQMGNQ